jgi:hypothetical protein
VNTSDGGTSVDTENLGGGNFWPLAVDSMLALAEQNEAQEAADKPVRLTAGDLALAALVVVPVVGVIGFFLWTNAPLLWALLSI